MEYILIFVALILVYLVMMYNSIVHAEMKVGESRSGMDVALAKRYSILANMQESVKGYVKHEKEVENCACFGIDFACGLDAVAPKSGGGI